MTDIPYKLEAGDIRPFVKPNTYFRHYRNKQVYRIMSISQDTESNTQYVTYRAMYAEGVDWTRPYDMFVELVEHEGGMVPRFTPVHLYAEPLTKLELFVYKMFYNFLNKRLADRPGLLTEIRNHQDVYELRKFKTKELLDTSGN